LSIATMAAAIAITMSPTSMIAGAYSARSGFISASSPASPAAELDDRRRLVGEARDRLVARPT
jgi:hypothetical protein